MKCPTCGQLIAAAPKTITTAEQLVAAMRELGRDSLTKDVYAAANGSGYFLTYTRGVHVDRRAIDAAVESGTIKQTWPNCSDSWSLPRKAAHNMRLWLEHERRDAQRSGGRRMGDDR